MGGRVARAAVDLDDAEFQAGILLARAYAFEQGLK